MHLNPTIPPDAQALLTSAQQLHRDGHYKAAAQALQDVLIQWPAFAEAHHCLGLWQYQSKQDQAALVSLKRAIHLDDRRADWHNDLGNLFAALGRDDEAAMAFRASLACSPHQVQVWSNLVGVLQRSERFTEALEAGEKALSSDASCPDIWRQLGMIHSALGDTLKAAHCQCQAYVLPPHEGKPPQMLAMSFYVLGRIADAAEVYRQWLKTEPDNPIATHMLSACTVQNVPPRASNAYLEHYFDQAAEMFDQKMLETLDYHIPELIGQSLMKHGLSKQSLAVLDAGCGTGLCGPHLTPWARELIGIDLSRKSLGIAAQKNCYDRLQQAEIVSYLQQQPAYFDLIVSADTFVYFGELAPFFSAAHFALIEGGLLLVSAEERFDAGPFGITPSGRYNHTQDYLCTGLRAAGFTLLELQQVIVRVELAVPVPGVLLIAKKASSMSKSLSTA